MTSLSDKAASPMDAASVDTPQEARLLDACRWCGDPAVVFTNRLGAHCADRYAEGREGQQLHEAGL